MSSFPCPLCGRLVVDSLQRLHLAPAPPVQRWLEHAHPGWKPADGVCPECVQAAAAAVRHARNPESLQGELMHPYPVYSAEDTRLLLPRQLINASPLYTGRDVTIAFLDSGFYPHPDLTQPVNRIMAYVDATGPTPAERMNFNRPHATSWHGLMTSCVAAGNGFMSDYHYSGVASQARLVLVKTGNPEGRGIREADIQRALAWVIANRSRFNIRVVNISLGGDHPPNGRLTELDQLVEEAVANNIVVVAASGNEDRERLLPPASAPSAVTVGGLDARNSFDRRFWRLYPSNYGRPVGVYYPKPELLAPARWLAAPMLPNTRMYNEGVFLAQVEKSVGALLQTGGDPGHEQARRHQFDSVRRRLKTRMVAQKFIHAHYQHVDGTSMAAPLVSGVAAQMLEVNPGLSANLVKEILIVTATPLEGFPPEKRGAGLVNSGRAVAAARRAARGVLTSLPMSPFFQPGWVSFYYFDPLNQATDVAVVGSLNGWNPQGFEMQSPSPGLWRLYIPSPPPGMYHYKFLVDDRWEHDPENPDWVEDGYGGFSSILDVRA